MLIYLIQVKKYNIIYADPPWKYRDKATAGAAEKHYQTMYLKEVCELPIKDISDKDCVLFLWCTYPQIWEGLQVIKNWGFEYKTIGFQWVKLNKKNNKPFYGIGHYTRSNSECCLIAIKGKPKPICKNISQLVFSRRRKHSQKPDIVRDKILQIMGDLPRIELFAREQIRGWDCWGDGVR